MKKILLLLTLIFCLACEKESGFQQISGTFNCKVYFYPSGKNEFAVDSFIIINPTIDFLKRCENPIVIDSGYFKTICKN